jgi:hypothetical protein
MIAQQLQEVLLTYIHGATTDVRPLIAGLIAAIGAVIIATVPHKIVGTQAWIAMFGPGLIALSLKQQLVHLRERRVPNAVIVHVAVACGFLAFIAIGIPAIRMAIVGPWCWGYPGLVLALTGITFLATISNSIWFSVLIIPLIWSSFSPSVQKWTAELCRGQQEEIGIRLFLVGVGTIAAALIWLLRMTEEDRAYQTWWASKPGDTYRREAVSTAQSEAVRQMWGRRWFLLNEPSEATMARWPMWAQGSLWERIRLCEAGRSMSTMLWFFFFMLPMFMVIPMWLMKRRVDVNNPPGFFFSMIVPAMIVIGQWYQQHPVWGLELLRPVDRKRYFQESGMTLATWTALAWAMQTVGWILVAAIIALGVNWPKLWMSVFTDCRDGVFTFRHGCLDYALSVGCTVHVDVDPDHARVVGFCSPIRILQWLVYQPGPGCNFSWCGCIHRHRHLLRRLPPLAQYRIGLKPHKESAKSRDGLPWALANGSHTPISSFHNCGFSRMKRRIISMQCESCSTSSFTPRLRSKSSSPMNV